jgi:16S rRNA C967 or C1407 C5-methylase (RsmB/RsmF family)/NOL1/NOP2/fmu family ribosome biogenesis protein
MSDAVGKLPIDFTSRMQTWLGEEAADFFIALGHRDVGLRLNPLRGPLPALEAVLPWDTRPVPWCLEGLWLGQDADVSKHPYHTAGVYYIQDPSAMAAAVLLDPKAGEWVLDIAAAPGGKASHIGSRMAGKGVFVANDVVRRRTSVLAKNIERMGISNALITNETPERLASRWKGLFDAVLVDAPCSGEGTFARDANSLQNWSLQKVAHYFQRQKSILQQAAPLVRVGGRILYGTCTFSPEENESVIDDFLKTQQDFNLVALSDYEHLFPGQPQWVGASEELRFSGRFWPHKGPGHGHFYALLERSGIPASDLPEQWKNMLCPGRVLSKYQSSMKEILVDDPPHEGLYLTPGDELYLTPMHPKMWADLHVLRPGLWLASLRHNKINPDHALAMVLQPDQVKRHVKLSVDELHLRNYLDGSQWLDTGEDGIVWISVNGFPLGWAKRIAGRLRSRYPVHLRR